MAINEHRFLILTALANGPRHGYGLVAEIEALTDGAQRPRAGSLYHALEKLESAGLVEQDHDQIVDGRLRRYYRLTEIGEVALRDEAAKRQKVTSEALRRLA